MDQRPSVVRIVHYQSFGTPGGEYTPAPRAAMVTQVHEASDGADQPDVGLVIFNPTGQFFNVRVAYSEKPSPGCWNWPPRV